MAVLLERDAQRAELEELLRDLALGRGSVLLVEGPAGIGKTELLRLAHSMATSRELEALQGKGGELERVSRSESYASSSSRRSSAEWSAGVSWRAAVTTVRFASLMRASIRAPGRAGNEAATEDVDRSL